MFIHCPRVFLRRHIARGLVGRALDQAPASSVEAAHVADSAARLIETLHQKEASGKLTVGIDLGDRSSRYCILDEQGEPIVEGSMATTRKGLAQALGSKPRSRVALEVGTHSPWVSRYLAKLCTPMPNACSKC